MTSTIQAEFAQKFAQMTPLRVADILKSADTLQRGFAAGVFIDDEEMAENFFPEQNGEGRFFI